MQRRTLIKRVINKQRKINGREMAGQQPPVGQHTGRCKLVYAPGPTDLPQSSLHFQLRQLLQTFAFDKLTAMFAFDLFYTFFELLRG